MFFSRTRYFIKVIGINFILLIFGLLVIELIFGNWFNPNHLDQLNIIRNRVINYKANELYPANFEMTQYIRDEVGFRGDYPSIKDIDILTIGGSTTDQRYITEGQTFQDILQNKFKENSKSIYVVNAGIDGQSTFGHIKNFEHWFPLINGLEPEYFLFYIGINDFYKDEGFMYDNMEDSELNWYRRIWKFFNSRSILVRLYITIKNVYHASMHGLNHHLGHRKAIFMSDNWTSNSVLSDYELILDERLKDFKNRLNVLCDYVESYGSKAIFVTQSQRRLYKFENGRLYGDPYLRNYDGYQYNGVDYYYMIKYFHKTIQNLSNDRGAIFIDLDNELDLNLVNDFYDSAHHTPSGAKKIGEYLYENLKSLF